MSVSVFVEGDSPLGKVFGDTRRLKTAVYTVPVGTSLLSTAALKSTQHVLLLPKELSTKANAAQVASALEKLTAQKGAVAAHLGPKTDGLYLSKDALEVLKQALATPAVAVPTRSDDDVPVADEFAVNASPVSKGVASPLLSRDAVSQADWRGLLAAALAAGTVTLVESPQLFVKDSPVPAPAQVSAEEQAKALEAYAAQYPASPVEGGFDGSPSTTASKDVIVYYNPDAVGDNSAAAATTTETVQTTTTATATSQDIAAAWWFWLLIVLLLIVLIVISVVAYYRR